MQGCAVCGELRVPQVGNAVEEVGQALDVEAGAPRIRGHPARVAKAFELSLECLAVGLQRHAFSVAAPTGADVNR